ncbi:hypothetical protein ACU686_14800 [Yinghuangia aomiensis]
MVVPGVGVYNAATGLARRTRARRRCCSLPGRSTATASARTSGCSTTCTTSWTSCAPSPSGPNASCNPRTSPPASTGAFAEMCAGRPRPVEIEVPPGGVRRDRRGDDPGPVRCP